MHRLLFFLLVITLFPACSLPAATPPSDTPTVATTPTNVRPPTPTRDPRLPTLPPRITPGPTATPFPLQAGWWDGAVCYEVFVRSFYDSDGDGIGDMNGIIAKLDYLNDGDPTTTRDLGVNCIWLMPVAEAASYHGYDTIDYYTVEKDYGTNEDFKRLVAEANKRGIKIIIDLVLNHTSTHHPWFQEALRDPNSPYRDWYLWSAIDPGFRGPFGNNVVWHKSPIRDEYYYGVFWGGMPDLNFRNPAVTAEAYKIARFWVEEMGVAGFRLDAIKHLIEYSTLQEDTDETFAWLREFRRFLDRELPGTFTVGEVYNGNPRTLAPYYPDQLDYYFEFEVAKQIVGAANTGLARLFMQAAQDAYTKLPYQRWAPFLTNHDQNRVMSVLGNDVAKAKLAALALLTMPGLPFIYYGEEIGMLGVKPDERIRTPMQWTKEEFGGFTSGFPWQMPQLDYPSKNVMLQDEDPDSLLNTYRQLIHLHINTPALATGDFIPLQAKGDDIAAYIRRSGDDIVMVIINFDAIPTEPFTLSLSESDLPDGTYQLVSLYGMPPAPPAPLTISNGAIVEYQPFTEIPAQTGYILKVER
ncbi:alpha-amylase family glycosyl hydrolase [uncultured Chloroflexus sp.]|uniref:alpha-amylase family glycosyl hydrolase n=1 Tax=uncultured Chloroflexus sp. TaxID=214040 RepID=UPI00260DE04F|nr:alpha-amylase family glycosyl hydrolase [uncultured Chloroflexus sp.]